MVVEVVFGEDGVVTEDELLFSHSIKESHNLSERKSKPQLVTALLYRLYSGCTDDKHNGKQEREVSKKGRHKRKNGNKRRLSRTQEIHQLVHDFTMNTCYHRRNGSVPLH